MELKTINQKERTVEVLASQTVIDRDHEVLVVETMNLSKIVGSPVLLHHNWQMIPIGKVISYRTEKIDGALALILKLQIGNVREYTEQDIAWQSIIDGLLNNISMGYLFDQDSRMVYVGEEDDEEIQYRKIDGAIPVECSFVVIPSLQTAGVLGTQKTKFTTEEVKDKIKMLMNVLKLEDLSTG